MLLSCFRFFRWGQPESRIHHYSNAAEAGQSSAQPHDAAAPPRIKTHPFFVMRYGSHAPERKEATREPEAEAGWWNVRASARLYSKQGARPTLRRPAWITYNYNCFWQTYVSYFGDTDTPILEYWWRLLGVSKPEWSGSLAEASMIYIPRDPPPVLHLLNSLTAN